MRAIGWRIPVGGLIVLVLLAFMASCGEETNDPGLDGGGFTDGGCGGDSGLVADCNDNPQLCVTSADCAPVGCKCYCQSCGDGFSFEDVVNTNCVEAWYDQHSCLPPVGCPGVCCPQRFVICENNLCTVVDGKI